MPHVIFENFTNNKINRNIIKHFFGQTQYLIHLLIQKIDKIEQNLKSKNKEGYSSYFRVINSLKHYSSSIEKKLNEQRRILEDLKYFIYDKLEFVKTNQYIGTFYLEQLVEENNFILKLMDMYDTLLDYKIIDRNDDSILIYLFSLPLFIRLYYSSYSVMADATIKRYTDKLIEICNKYQPLLNQNNMRGGKKRTKKIKNKIKLTIGRDGKKYYFKGGKRVKAPKNKK